MAKSWVVFKNQTTMAAVNWRGGWMKVTRYMQEFENFGAMERELNRDGCVGLNLEKKTPTRNQNSTKWWAKWFKAALLTRVRQVFLRVWVRQCRFNCGWFVFLLRPWSDCDQSINPIVVFLNPNPFSCWKPTQCFGISQDAGNRREFVSTKTVMLWIAFTTLNVKLKTSLGTQSWRWRRKQKVLWFGKRFLKWMGQLWKRMSEEMQMVGLWTKSEKLQPKMEWMVLLWLMLQWVDAWANAGRRTRNEWSDGVRRNETRAPVWCWNAQRSRF